MDGPEGIDGEVRVGEVWWPLVLTTVDYDKGRSRRMRGFSQGLFLSCVISSLPFFLRLPLPLLLLSPLRRGIRIPFIRILRPLGILIKPLQSSLEPGIGAQVRAPVLATVASPALVVAGDGENDLAAGVFDSLNRTADPVVELID